MAKKKKSRKRKSPNHRQRVLSQGQINILGQANHVVNLAQNNDSRVVTLGSLLFFSTETGDAWMLDPGDGLALCLARGGEKQPVAIVENSTSFSIEWNMHYRIEGDTFVVAEPSGRIRTIWGYPVGEILKAAARLTTSPGY